MESLIDIVIIIVMVLYYMDANEIFHVIFPNLLLQVNIAVIIICFYDALAYFEKCPYYIYIYIYIS